MFKIKFLSYNFLRIFFSFLAMSFLASSAVYSSDSDDIRAYRLGVKERRQENFNRNEKFIRLPNGLDVFIIQEPAAKQAFVSMSVNVGLWDDSPEHRGIAHYLEHMLFLGTKDYPNASEYQQYIKRNNGMNNAYTTVNLTNYYFSINDSALEGALDRFSRFFSQPLFDEQQIINELKNVDSEYVKNQTSNPHKFLHVQRILSNHSHPNKLTFQGNKETLSNISKEAVLEFYNKFYIANQMKLVIMSPLPVENVLLWVEEKFSPIPSGIAPSKGDYVPMYRADQLPRLVEIKPVGSQRQMQVLFTSRLINQDSHAHLFLKTLFNRTDKGSLMDLLKSRGLIVDMGAINRFQGDQYSLLLNIILTEAGEKKWQDICREIFVYINALKQKELSESFYRELRSLNEIKFISKQPPITLDAATNIANAMHEYPWDEAESANTLVTHFDNDSFQNLLREISPNKAQVFLLSNELTHESKDARTNPFFSTLYRESPIADKEIKLWSEGKNFEGKIYPEPNKYIPRTLICKTDSTSTESYEDESCLLWTKSENVSNQALASLRMEILLPSQDSLEHSSLKVLFRNCLHFSNEKWMGTALDAGFSGSVVDTSTGLSVSIKGYSDKVYEFADDYIEALRTISLSEEEFISIKEKILMDIKSASEKTTPYLLAHKKLMTAISFNSFPAEMQVEPIKKISLADVKQFAQSLLTEIFVEGCGFGDTCSKDVDSLVKNLFIKSGARPLCVDRKPAKEHLEIKNGEHFYQKCRASNNVNVICSYHQMGGQEPRLVAALKIGEKILGQDFYDDLRTKQSLGYVAMAWLHRNSAMNGFLSVIQSEKNMVDLSAAVDLWLLNAADRIENLPPDQFEQTRNAIIESMLKPSKTYEEKSSDFFDIIFNKKANFDWKKSELAVLENITQQETAAIFREKLSSPNAARITLFLLGKDEEKLEEFLPLGTEITDVKEFHHSSGRRPY